ncbi:HAD family hydrolase [Streptantibioticus rubrisoli]|uniref:HAD family hydrolase n=1 Tax=Streptantibioticus rubrisoli TaxID=1387313 RepID=A0ABT1PEG9_9ACTN|nr:HAD family hydrolase [Streptantibioticus rubrisoli]MCQ4043767.1 HAD family hydrolase [Streptantibioticus rubrisoli]
MSRHSVKTHDEQRDDAGRAALFDVDGTLVDTNYLHVVTWWEAFRQSGHTVPMTAIHSAVGMGSDKLVAHLLGDGRDSGQDAEIAQAHKALFATYLERLHPLKGASDLLRTVSQRGWQVMLASSAGEYELNAMRSAIGADEYIAAATSADDVDASKPAPNLVMRALDRAGVSASRAVFVGDTVWDVESSAKAGVDCVALLSGGVPGADLRRAGALAVYEDPGHLLAEIDSSPFADARR